jgi:Tfp pilus assembly protein PilV
MSLAEVMVAVLLSAVVMVTGLNLLTTTVSSQISAARQTRLQGDAYLAWRAVAAELRQSTAIVSPASVGAQSDILSGCENYDPSVGPLSASAPVTAFLFCESSGNVYYYRFTPSSCPPAAAPGCGGAGGMVVASSVAHRPEAPFYFSRTAPGLVRFNYQTTASGQSQPVDVSIAFNAAAGTNQ